MRTILVTQEQAQAALTEVYALTSAGLTPDPLLRQIADARPATAVRRRPLPARADAAGDAATESTSGAA